MNESEKRSSSITLYNFCRYFVAFFIISYGWAKIMGSQFTVLDSELDKPLRDVPGFWLTWHYFSFSPIYGNLIATIQIISGFLLTFRKTVLLAACLLFGLLGNIVLIDIFYGIDTGGLLMAVLLEIAVTIILFHHFDELKEFFWTKQNSVIPKTVKTLRFAKTILIVIFVVLPPSCTYYVANYNNRVPTEIDGTWRVVKTSESVLSNGEPLSKIYFEYNRAFMTTFRFGQKTYETHHFEVNPQTKEIHIWKNWLTKDEKIFEGKYNLAEKKLELDGLLQSADKQIRIELEKE